MNTDQGRETQEAVFSRPQLPAVVRFVLAIVLIVIVNMFLPRLCFSLFGNHVMVADALYRWLGSLLLLGGFIFFARVLDQVEDNEWGYIGLPRGRGAASQYLLGVSIGAILISLSVAAIAIWGGITMHLDLTGRSAMRASLITLLLLGGALLEELMFRGYPFQRLIESVGAPIAILLLSVFFGAVHLGNPNAGGYLSWGFFNTLAVGVLFAVAYLRTKSLWFPLGIHFSWNFFLGVVYGLPVSGIRDFSVLVRSTAHGPKLLTGGAYGIEASLTGSIVIVVGLLVVSFIPQNLLVRGFSAPPVVPESI